VGELPDLITASGRRALLFVRPVEGHGCSLLSAVLVVLIGIAFRAQMASALRSPLPLSITQDTTTHSVVGSRLLRSDINLLESDA
jgi:hypothetical protein